MRSDDKSSQWEWPPLASITAVLSCINSDIWYPSEQFSGILSPVQPSVGMVCLEIRVLLHPFSICVPQLFSKIKVRTWSRDQLKTSHWLSKNNPWQIWAMLGWTIPCWKVAPAPMACSCLIQWGVARKVSKIKLLKVVFLFWEKIRYHSKPLTDLFLLIGVAFWPIWWN